MEARQGRICDYSKSNVITTTDGKFYGDYFENWDPHTII